MCRGKLDVALLVIVYVDKDLPLQGFRACIDRVLGAPAAGPVRDECAGEMGEERGGGGGGRGCGRGIYDLRCEGLARRGEERDGGAPEVGGVVLVRDDLEDELRA